MKQIKVLCVDDSLVFRSLLSHTLRESDQIEVIGTAMHGRAAIQSLNTLDPDVITLDVNMPELDGISTLQQIKEKKPGILIVMVSSLTSEGADTTLRAMELGASDFILKPINETPEMIHEFKETLKQKILRLKTDRSLLPFDMNNNPITEQENFTIARAKSLLIPGKKPLCLICACEENQLGHLLLSIRALSPSECPVPILFKIMVPLVFLESLINSFKRNNQDFQALIPTETFEMTRGNIYLIGQNQGLDLVYMSGQLRGIIKTTPGKSSINDFFRNLKETKLPNTPVCLMANDSNSDGILGLAELTDKGIPTVFLTKNRTISQKKEWAYCNQAIDLNYSKTFFKGLF